MALASRWADAEQFGYPLRPAAFLAARVVLVQLGLVHIRADGAAGQPFGHPVLAEPVPVLVDHDLRT